MLNIPYSENPRVVIIGGGFGGINLAKSLRKKNFQVVLLDRNNYHLFQPLLYQVATGGLDPGSIAFPLRKILSGDQNSFFRICEVEKITPEKNEVETSIGSIRYDYLVIATGTTTNYFGMDSFKRNSLPMKSVTEALDIRSFVLQNFETALDAKDNREKEALINFVIVGGGPAGVELAGALGEMRRFVLPDDYPEIDFRKMRVYLFEAGARLLPGMSERSSALAKKYLEQLSVTVLLNKRVDDYDGTNVKFTPMNDKSGEAHSIAVKTVLWTAGVEGTLINGIPENTVTRSKRIKVDSYNKVTGTKNIFAIGDIAAMESEELPKGHPQLAPVAIQQGKTLAKNLILIAAGKGERLIPFKYFDKGIMATVGRNRAVAEALKLKLGGWMAWQAWLWAHLLFLIGFRNKIAVLLDWIWNYITYDRAIRLIIHPFKRDN